MNTKISATIRMIPNAAARMNQPAVRSMSLTRLDTCRSGEGVCRPADDGTSGGDSTGIFDGNTSGRLQGAACPWESTTPALLHSGDRGDGRVAAGRSGCGFQPQI